MEPHGPQRDKGKKGALHTASVICILQKKPYMQVSFCHDFRIAGSLRAEVSHPISCKSRWRERAPHHFLQRIVSTPKFSYLFLSPSLSLSLCLCVVPPLLRRWSWSWHDAASEYDQTTNTVPMESASSNHLYFSVFFLVLCRTGGGRQGSTTAHADCNFFTRAVQWGPAKRRREPCRTRGQRKSNIC
jgi:hypothetical protein